jgi:acetyl-CoA acyltransferase
MLAHVLRSVIAQAPGIDVARIDDAIIGCAMPEAEQGMNVGAHRRAARRPAAHHRRADDQPVLFVRPAGCRPGRRPDPHGPRDLMLAGGTESMSMVPMMGNKVALSPQVFANNENVAIAYGMGITAEKVAEQWKVSREDQDCSRWPRTEGDRGDPGRRIHVGDLAV